jgi:hypothetical protein
MSRGSCVSEDTREFCMPPSKKEVDGGRGDEKVVILPMFSFGSDDFG